MISFACPYCRADISAPDDRAGDAGRCSACKRSVVVPNPATVLAGPARMPLRHSRWSVARRLTWGMAALVIVYKLVSYPIAMHHAETVFQAIFAAADACVWIIGAYTMARCVDAISRLMEPGKRDAEQGL